MLTLHCQCEFSLLIIYWGEWEVSHTCQGYFSQRALQSWARTRSENSVCKLSTGGVGSLNYYFLVVILLHVISSFTLNLLLFHEISELWGTNACFCCCVIEVEERPPESLNCQQERFQHWKLWTPQLCFPQRMQKHNSAKPCNLHQCREMNNIPVILYKGEWRSNKDWFLLHWLNIKVVQKTGLQISGFPDLMTHLSDCLNLCVQVS